MRLTFCHCLGREGDSSVGDFIGVDHVYPWCHSKGLTLGDQVIDVIRLEPFNLAVMVT